MPSGIIIHKYHIREDKKKNHIIRLRNNTKRKRVISDSVYKKLVNKYLHNSKQPNDYPNSPMVVSDKMIEVNEKIQRLGNKELWILK